MELDAGGAACAPVVFLASPQGNVLTWSQACARLTGYLSAQSPPLTLHRLLGPGAGGAAPAAAPPAGAYNGRCRLKHAGGAEFPVLVKTERHRLSDGSVLICEVRPLDACAASGIADLTLPNIIEGLPCLLYVIDGKGRLVLWNRRLCDAVGIAPERLRHTDVTAFFAPEDRPAIAAEMRRTLERGSSSIEACLVSQDGRRTPFLFESARMGSERQVCIFGTGMDISERREREQRLKVTQRAMDACADAVAITRYEGGRNRIVYVNPAFTRLTGYGAQESAGRDASFLRAGLLDVAEHERIERALAARESVHAVLRCVRKNGELFWNELRIEPVVDEASEATDFVAVIRDVTDERRDEEQLRHLATHDPLTGLANRAMLHDRLQVSVDRAQRDGSCVGVAFLDLDDFKRINDAHGHEAGDRVLKSVAGRLLGAVRAGDTAARIGGDKFVAIFNDCLGADHVGEMVKRMHARVIDPIALQGKEILPSVSIGIGLFPHDGVDGAAVLRAADAAMYRAKTGGKNRYKFYAADMDRTVHDYLERETSLREAIERNELFLGFQPKVDLGSGLVAGAEALVRWNHPREGIVMPDDFIGLAEDTGLIVPLGEWVLRHACAVMHDIRREGYDRFSMSVNLSARQLRQEQFVPTVARMLRQFRLAEGTIELEVTESQLMDNPAQAVKTLDRLKNLGVQLSIDDFGTGYSSLSHLKAFPVDYIKIDRSFLLDLDRSGDSVIAQAIISLGHNLNMKVIAEGVETDRQLSFLREHGCDQIQGHCFSPAISEGALFGLLKSGACLR